MIDKSRTLNHSIAKNQIDVMSKKSKKGNSPRVAIKGKGNILEFKNNMTPKEHQAFLDQIKVQRPLLYESLKQRIDNVIDKINQFNKIDLLAGFGVLLLNERQVYGERSDGELNFEYALSIATASANDISKPNPSPEVLMQIESELNGIRKGFAEYYSTESIESSNLDQQSLIRFRIIVDSLGTRGEGYEIHFEEVFRELFGLHDKLIKNKFDFEFNDILGLIKEVEINIERKLRLLSINHKNFLNWADQQNPHELIKRYGKISPKLMYEKETGIRTSLPRDQYRLELKQITQKQVNVAKTLSLKFGENLQFLNPKFKAQPLNDTLISIKPIVNDGYGKYYFFSTLVAHRNLFRIGEELIQLADKGYYYKNYLGKGSTSRSSYVEQKTMRCLNRIINSEKAYLNLKYDISQIGGTNDAELDGLILTEKANYLIEAKSDGVPNAAKRGALDSLKVILSEKKGIGKGSQQAERAERFIIETTDPMFRTDSGEQIYIDKEKPIIKIVVTLSSIWGLTTQLKLLQDLDIMVKTLSIPWVVNLFDLMVFSDFFENKETNFINYLDWRLPLNEKNNFYAEDELNLLGLFYSPSRNSTIEEIESDKHIQLSKFTAEMDLYYSKLYSGQEATKPFVGD